jgi:hypothetical protein
LSNLTVNEIEIDLVKAASVLKRYTAEYKVHPHKDYIEAEVKVLIPREPANFFVIHLKCDSQDLHMAKVRKFEEGTSRPLNVTKGWKENPLAEPKFKEIREAVRKEAGKPKASGRASSPQTGT